MTNKDNCGCGHDHQHTEDEGCECGHEHVTMTEEEILAHGIYAANDKVDSLIRLLIKKEIITEDEFEDAFNLFQEELEAMPDFDEEAEEETPKKK